MPPLRDYYSLLEIGERAGSDEVKRAYYRLARLYHPDCNRDDPDTAERFKALQEAYTVLSDPFQRQAYDQARHTSYLIGSRSHANGHVNGFASRPAAAGLDGQEFASLFAQAGTQDGQRGSTAPRFADGHARGQTLEVQVQLSFEQALKGGTARVQHPYGAPTEVPFPRGVRSGWKVCVPGGGQAAPGLDGQPGDLHVTFRVDPGGRFRREGNDLHVVETVSALEAMLGATRTLVNAYGQRVKLPIPPGTQPGDRLRLRRQGVETADGRGDLYIEVQVAVPRDLSAEQREALAEAARRCGLL